MSTDKYGIGNALSETPLLDNNINTNEEKMPQQKHISQEPKEEVEIEDIIEKNSPKAKTSSTTDTKEEKDYIEEAKKKERKYTFIAVTLIILTLLLVFGYFLWSNYQDMVGEQGQKASSVLGNTNTQRELPAGYAEVKETIGVDGLKESSTFRELSNENIAKNQSAALSKSNTVPIKKTKLENMTSKKQGPEIDNAREEASQYPVQGEREEQESLKSNLPKELYKTKKNVAPKKNISVTKEKNMTPQEKEIMGLTNPIDETTGGVCNLSVKYKLNSEYIPYVKVNSAYVPIFKTKDWDKKGVKLTRRIVVLGHDKSNKFTEIEEGMFLPSEMFSECSFYDKKEH